MKKYLAIILALVMVLSLAACGSSSAGNDAPPETSSAPEAQAPETKAPEESPAAEDKNDVDVSGVYTFVEISDMGASLWTLTLNADGTYSVEQDNPFGDETVGEGEYTAEGTTVSCGPIDSAAFHGKTESSKFADRLMGGFVGDNNSIEWEVNVDDGTAVPVGFTGTVGTLDDIGGKDSDEPSIYGVYTFEEESDMGISIWTLELHPDGTYSIEQDNPFGDETVGEGEYTAEGAFISCGSIDASAFHGKTESSKFADRLMGGFVGDDNSTEWIVNRIEGTMEPNA